MAVEVWSGQPGAEQFCCVQCVQISDPWLLHEVLAVAGRHPHLIDKPRGFPLPVYDCFDRVRPASAECAGACRCSLCRSCCAPVSVRRLLPVNRPAPSVETEGACHGLCMRAAAWNEGCGLQPGMRAAAPARAGWQAHDSCLGGCCRERATRRSPA